jgi:hypothetical protein
MRGPSSTRAVELSLLLTAAASICLAQYPYRPPDAGNYSAHVVTAVGQISLYKDSQLLALSTGDTVQVTQTIVSGPDGHATLQVSDGSTIEVYPNSELVFRKNTGDWKDLLDLLIGTIRVHIEHFGSQPNPNRIMTPTAVISVRGTTFDVSVDEDDETTEVDVEEGTVVVRHALLPSSRTVTLQTGESIKVSKNVPLASAGLDKNTLAKYILQIAREIALTIGERGYKINIPGGGGGSPGDTGCKPGVPGCGGSAPPPPPIN